MASKLKKPVWMLPKPEEAQPPVRVPFVVAGAAVVAALLIIATQLPAQPIKVERPAQTAAPALFVVTATPTSAPAPTFTPVFPTITPFPDQAVAPAAAVEEQSAPALRPSSTGGRPHDESRP